MPGSRGVEYSCAVVPHHGLEAGGDVVATAVGHPRIEPHWHLGRRQMRRSVPTASTQNKTLLS